MTPGLRVVFFGTPSFAVPSFERLLASRHRVVAAITRPDRPRDRGQRVAPPPVKELAERHGIPVLQPERLGDPAFLAAISAHAPDCGVVAAYGKILPETLLAIPRFGLLNVHASLLPRYRGAAPIERAIMNGDAETGVTIMRVVKALDAGPTFAARARPIGPDETGADVEGDLALLGADLLMEVLDRLGMGREPVPQDETLATYAPRLAREDGLIDWSRPCAAIHDQVRALHPWPHAFTFAGDRRLIVLRTACTGQPHGVPPSESPGRILVAAGGTIRVATGTTPIDLLSVQLEGRRPMSAREVLAGRHLEAGLALGGGPAPNTGVDRRP